MKHQYKNSSYEQPAIGQEVYISVADWPKQFPNAKGHDILMIYQGRGDCHSARVWWHATRGLFYGDRLWRSYVKEDAKPVWIDSRKEKPVPDSLPVWITHGPGEEVREATFTRWCGPGPTGGVGMGWKVGGTTFIDPFFWQEREVPKVITPPEPMPEPVRTDGWLRLGATKPAHEQQVWVATVNQGVQPARYFVATAPRLTAVAGGDSFFSVTSGPEVGQIYGGNFLLWQPRQAQPEYPIL